MGGDFNCVEDVELDTRAKMGRSTYGNTHGPKLRAAINTMGYVDAHRLVNGPTQSGFTRLSGSIHTRIDRLYTPMTQSRINWQRVGPHPTLFTGKGASDHLPLIGSFEFVGYNEGRVYDIRINGDLLEEEDTQRVLNHLWNGHITADTPDDKLEEAWANAKKAVATYLLWATRQGEDHKTITKA
eukprot:scaffold37240_cov39-Tisochrysis_lutea.AAC.1